MKSGFQAEVVTPGDFSHCDSYLPSQDVAIKLADKEETKQASNLGGKRNHVAVKVWSKLLQAHLWVVADEEDIKIFTNHSLKGDFYTENEIQKLNCLDRDSLKALHTILFDN